MGQNTSVQETPEVRKYTSTEIETNLKRLFKNNINNNFSEASQSFGRFTEQDLDDELKQTLALVGGNNIKFKSSKNRHLNHNIDEFIKKIQSGGEAPISEQSEFAKIKEFLLKEANVNLIGGAIEEDGINYESISSISGFDEFKNTLSQTQEGGRKRKRKVASLANILQSGQLGGDRDPDSGDELDLSESESVKLSSTSEQEVDIETVNLSPTSFSDSKKEESEQKQESESEEGFSPTSNQSASSGLNIVPFYSSESSNTHPYTRNRLNK